MDSDESLIRFLFSRRRFGLKPGLERISELLAYLGHPERKFEVIHVAGTNGKGSTSAFLESLLRATGIRTGLYTSPHLVNPEERIRVNYHAIPREEFVALISDLRQRVEAVEATFFEAMTAIGLAYFASKQVDVAVVEVGLGGRWDATNAVAPTACIITDVHLDHQVHLGRSVRQIAAEKAGIIKKGVPCFTYVRSKAALEVLREHALNSDALLQRLQARTRLRVRRISEDGTVFDYQGVAWKLRGLETKLTGAHQARNAGLALFVVEATERGPHLLEDQLREALASVHWDGRFQILSHYPKRVVDVAHNIQGVRAFLETYIRVWPREQRGVLVTGVLRDKAFRGMFRLLRGICDRVVVCSLPSLRSATVEELAEAGSQAGYRVWQGASPWQAWQKAEDLSGNAPLVALGSHYLVGEILQGLGRVPE